MENIYKCEKCGKELLVENETRFKPTIICMCGGYMQLTFRTEAFEKPPYEIRGIKDTGSGKHEGVPDKNICINCAHCYDLKEIGYYLDDVACELYMCPYPYIERNTEACEYFEQEG